MISEHRFREDLYFRINTVEVELPPLRERKEDIPSLAEFFIKKYEKIRKKRSQNSKFRRSVHYLFRVIFVN
jgi:transcriptional regulator with PAS, ATPase and Fis domain